MQKRTFERRKRHFREDIQFRVNEIVGKEFVSYFIDAIDKMVVATNQMMSLLEEDDIEIQMQANREIRENLKLLGEFYDSKAILNGMRPNVQKQERNITTI